MDGTKRSAERQVCIKGGRLKTCSWITGKHDLIHANKENSSRS